MRDIGQARRHRGRPPQRNPNGRAAQVGPSDKIML